MNKVTNRDFYSLMGHCEMECALAAMVNKARSNGCLFSDVVVEKSDFDTSGLEREGFVELISFGWLEHVSGPAGINGRYKANFGLVRRLHQRIPNA